MQNTKPVQFKLSKSRDHAILVQVDELESFYSRFHMHPEFQITANVRGEGILYADNSISSFTEGDVIMVGSNVPHLFKTSPKQSARNINGVLGISLFFDMNSLGEGFFNLKEMENLKRLLHESQRVFKLNKKKHSIIHSKIINCQHLEKEDLVLNFMEILILISNAKKNFLNPVKEKRILNKRRNDRLNKVLEYTISHSHEEITIDEISAIAYLSKSQFSNYFKKHTNKTFIQFLNQLRIENACLLLKENQLSIQQICYYVGFKNLSNFNRQFKKNKQLTPSKYRREWLSELMKE